MDKQQKLKIALPILFVIMAFIWGPIIFSSGGRSSPKQKSEINLGNISINLSGKVQSLNLDGASQVRTGNRARTSFQEWGRNPFIPGYDPKAMFLEGIAWDEQNPKAVINGNIMSVGDYFGSSRITAINQNSVIIRSDEGDVEVFLGEGREL